MHEAPEYSVSCQYPNGGYGGKAFDVYSEAEAYMQDAIDSRRYVQVRLYDAVDNLLDDWDANDDLNDTLDDDRDESSNAEYSDNYDFARHDFDNDQDWK